MENVHVNSLYAGRARESAGKCEISSRQQLPIRLYVQFSYCHSLLDNLLGIAVFSYLERLASENRRHTAGTDHVT